MHPLINGATVPFLMFAQAWAAWAIATLPAAAVVFCFAKGFHVSFASKIPWWWLAYGLSGPPRLIVALVDGLKPAKKKGGR